MTAQTIISVCSETHALYQVRGEASLTAVLLEDFEQSVLERASTFADVTAVGKEHLTRTTRLVSLDVKIDTAEPEEEGGEPGRYITEVLADPEETRRSLRSSLMRQMLLTPFSPEPPRKGPLLSVFEIPVEAVEILLEAYNSGEEGGEECLASYVYESKEKSATVSLPGLPGEDAAVMWEALCIANAAYELTRSSYDMVEGPKVNG